MKRHLFFLLFLFLGIELFAQSLFTHPNVTSNKKVKKIPNIALNINNKQISFFSLGITARMKEISGISLNLISTQVENKMRGIQISGLANLNQETTGLQFAGICNINAKKANSITIGGLANINAEKHNGILIAGLTNINMDNCNGVGISGLCNINNRHQNGINIAGISNITAGNTNGFSLCLLSNITAGESRGVQVSSLLNVSGKEAKGVQLSALFNVTQKLNGCQIGCVNFADSISSKGLQIGLVNYATSYSTKQIGIANLRPDTHYELLITSGNYSKFNVDIRFRNRYTYTTFGIGYQSFHLKSKPNFNLSYRIGAYKKICSLLTLSSDLGFVHVETLKNKPKRLYELQIRSNIEFSLSKKTHLIGSIGYNWTRHYNKDINERKGILYSLGFYFKL